MADIVNDGMTKVAWVPTISSIAAPTTAEIGAGEDLELFLTPDGLSMEFSNDEVDVTSLGSTFASALPGRQSLSTELMLKDQGRDVAPWSTFASKPTGYIVVRRNVARTTAWATSDAVEVYPVQAGQRRPAAPAANEVAKFAVTFFHTSQPDMAAVVA